ncbi:hypothetical protein MASR2M15_06390 [Anaerolineales bacterium]
MAIPPKNMSQTDFSRAVEHVIRERKTTKVLRDPASENDLSLAPDFSELIDKLLDIAGWAPFHKIAHAETHLHAPLDSIVPWRFYVIEQATCQAVLNYLEQQAHTASDPKWAIAWASKIPRLIAATGALILVTWLPDPAPDGPLPVMNENNIEHIAAASAAVQNLLLAAEAHGLFSYWCTGGILADADVFRYFDIPLTQRLLGAIFLRPQTEIEDPITVQPGALRHKRGPSSSWSRRIELP